jgi:hypothetical protein
MPSHRCSIAGLDASQPALRLEAHDPALQRGDSRRTCTLIGTSTNRIVAGLVAQHSSLAPVGFFEIAWVGVPSAIAGIGFVLLGSRWLLPDRRPPITEPTEYAVEMLVEARSPQVGRSIEQAGLRSLPGVYLAEIERDGTLLPAVAPTERLRGATGWSSSAWSTRSWTCTASAASSRRRTRSSGSTARVPSGA